MNNKQQTAVEWLQNEIWEHIEWKPQSEKRVIAIKFQQAKEMQNKNRGYTKEDVLKAGEMGEINHHDTQHIITYLDEAKAYNETYGGGEQ
jgi:hypothetical protein